jgi:hypothetical protein
METVEPGDEGLVPRVGCRSIDTLSTDRHLRRLGGEDGMDGLHVPERGGP